jgi:hypothetical protein
VQVYADPCPPFCDPFAPSVSPCLPTLSFLLRQRIADSLLACMSEIREISSIGQSETRRRRTQTHETQKRVEGMMMYTYVS